MNRVMANKEVEIKKKLFMKCNEFNPALTPRQYKVYVKHIELVIDNFSSPSDNYHKIQLNRKCKKRGCTNRRTSVDEYCSLHNRN